MDFWRIGVVLGDVGAFLIALAVCAAIRRLRQTRCPGQGIRLRGEFFYYENGVSVPLEELGERS